MKTPNIMKDVCVICGSAKNLQMNHAGGRHHIAWFTMTFSERHQQQFDRLLERVGIDLRYTPNKLKRLVIAALALTIALWMVLQALGEAVSLLPEKKP